MSRPTRLGFQTPLLAYTGMVEVRNAEEREQRGSAARGAGAEHRTAPGDEPGGEPLGNDLRDDLRAAGQADAGFSGAHQPGWTGHAVCGRHHERDRTGVQPRRGFVCDLARGGQRFTAWTRPASHTVYAEGMGVATGAAFDGEGNLFVGDRSGTIFKINPRAQDFCACHAGAERQRPITWRWTRGNAVCDRRRRSRRTTRSGRLSRTGTRGRGIAGWGGRRGWRWRATATSTWPRACEGGAGLARVTQSGEATLVLAGTTWSG